MFSVCGSVTLNHAHNEYVFKEIIPKTCDGTAFMHSSRLCGIYVVSQLFRNFCVEMPALGTTYVTRPTILNRLDTSCSLRQYSPIELVSVLHASIQGDPII